MKNTTIATLVLAAFAAISTAQNQPPLFVVTDLGAMNGESEAFAINNSNQVVGWSFLQNGARGAMLWQNGNMTCINNTGGNSVAYGINDDGVIVGRRGNRATVFSGINQSTDLGTFGGQGSTAWGLNEGGKVAGTAQLGDGNWFPFSGNYNGQANLINLGSLGGLTSVARDVNNVNVYAGFSSIGGPTHATMWVVGQTPQDMGTLGGPQSEAHSISDYFGVTGWADLALRHKTATNQGNVKRAFLWTPENGKKNLGSPWANRTMFNEPGTGRTYFWLTYKEGEITKSVKVYGVDTFGEGVNRWNAVCGYARLYTGPNPGQLDRAIVFLNGKMWDLNDLIGNQNVEWTLDHAWALNDGTTIVGRGRNHFTGSYRAFIATRIR